jgi:hypothetical protein
MFTSLLLLLSLGTTTQQVKLADEPLEPKQQIVYYAKRYGVDPDLAVRIADCESHLAQFKDGKVLRGVQNPQDIGLFQINEKYHLENSKKAGLNIYEQEGNIKYAALLMRDQGTTPWNWSKNCWQVRNKINSAQD